MTSNEQQQFLNSLEKKLWQCTDKLRSTLDAADFSAEDYQTEIASELEQRDYYTEQNVFWVPKEARWQFLQDKNKAAIGGLEITGEDGKTRKITSVGHLIDNALKAIEHDNPKLKGVLNKRYTQLQIDQSKLAELS